MPRPAAPSLNWLTSSVPDSPHAGNPGDHLKDLAAFVTASPSSYHAVAEAERRLVEAGFAKLAESDAWAGAPARAFVVRDGAIVAWVLPQRMTPTTPFRIVGSHTDSPGFRLKPKPTTASHGWLQAGVEVYGGPLLNSWLDRELEFAGRIVFRDGTTALVRTGPFLRFPQLAVHLDRGVNTDGLVLNPQTQMNPVIGLSQASRSGDAGDAGGAGDADIVAHLARLAGGSGADVAGYDIAVADTTPPSVFGIDAQLFASGRLDNLVSVHASIVALIALSEAEQKSGNERTDVAVLAAFDHEEVGSATRSGASGPFLADTLTRISGLAASVSVSSTEPGSTTPVPAPATNQSESAESTQFASTESAHLRALAGSWCLSADVGHSVHPNYPDRHDPANRPLAGRGPILKINANQRYATDGVGAAEWARACARAGVPYQEFVSNNAIACGSTTGPLTATRLGVRTIDVGIAVLSMHSARELCSADDPALFSQAIAAFLAPNG